MFNKKVIISFVVFLINTICSLSAMDIMVETRDGATFTFTQEAIQESKLLTNMIADCDDTAQNPLMVSNDVTSHEMSIIKELSDLLAQQKTLSREEVIKKCKTALMAKKLSMDSLIHLLNATNYLNCDTIMSVSSDLLSTTLIKESRTKRLEEMLKMKQTFTLPAEMSSLVASMMAEKYGLHNNHAMPKLLINEIKNNPPSHFVFSHDKSLIALVMNDCSKVVVWNMQEDIMIATLPSRDCITALNFSPSKDTLVIASENKQVRLWNLATKKYQLLTTLRAPAKSLSFSPNGTNLVTSSYIDTKKWLVQVWDVASQENRKNYDTKGSVVYNSQNQLIYDKKIIAYKKMIEMWHITHPDLQHDMQKLLIDDVVILHWLLEVISINDKAQLHKAPPLIKETINNLMIDKPELASILQPYLISEKTSWCAIS